jgi:hypothetical protein
LFEYKKLENNVTYKVYYDSYDIDKRSYLKRYNKDEYQYIDKFYNFSEDKNLVKAMEDFYKNKDKILNKIKRNFLFGGKSIKPSRYTLTDIKVNLIHKNKHITRNIYVNNKSKKQYCKVDKKYVQLAKLIK